MTSTDPLIDAFDSVCDGYSTDRVVADPEMNACFIDACRERGLTDPVVQLNRTLLNARKAGKLSGRPRSKMTSFPDQHEYRFAAEMSIRFMERKHSASLDDVICEPDLVAEFDELAAEICPGYSKLQYRWAALSLRKAGGLEPEIGARILTPEQVLAFAVDQLNVDRIPREQGLYLVSSSDTLLYVGESENLRTRLAEHLEHSDNKLLARWLWSHGTEEVRLEVQVLPANTTTKVRKALELELIRSRNPVFNVQR